MSVKYEIVAPTGTYTDREGNEKKRYVKMGVVLAMSKGGYMIKVESIPTGWDGTAFLNEPQEKKDDRKPARRPADDLDSDVPF